MRWRLAPQLEGLGPGYHFMKPWYMRLNGPGLSMGRQVHCVTAADRFITLSSWVHAKGQGRITIGDFCLLCPGVRIDSAVEVTLGPSCMVAAGAYLTDADWHDLYDRTEVVGARRPRRKRLDRGRRHGVQGSTHRRSRYRRRGRRGDEGCPPLCRGGR